MKCLFKMSSKHTDMTQILGKLQYLRSTTQAKPPLLNLSVYLAEARMAPFGRQASSTSTWLRCKKLDFSSFEKVESSTFYFLSCYFFSCFCSHHFWKQHFGGCRKYVRCRSLRFEIWPPTNSMVSSREMRNENDDKPILPIFLGGALFWGNDLLKHSNRCATSCHAHTGNPDRVLKQNIGRSWP